MANCCNCFGPMKSQWNDSVSGQMSEVYCRICDDDDSTQNPIDNIDSPACLTNVTSKKNLFNGDCKPKHTNILTVESELELLTSKVLVASQNVKKDNLIECGGGNAMNGTPIKIKSIHENNNKNIGEEYELADDATICDGDGDELNDSQTRINHISNIDSEILIRVQGKEELPVSPEEQIQSEHIQCNNFRSQISRKVVDNKHHPSNRNSSRPNTEKLIYKSEIQETVLNGKPPVSMELQHPNEKKNELNIEINRRSSNDSVKQIPNKINCTNDHPLLLDQKCDKQLISDKENILNNGDDMNGNNSMKTTTMTSTQLLKRMHRMYSTLPKMKKTSAMQQMLISNSRPLKKIPTRLTPDGTTIYYWCDLSKQAIKGHTKKYTT